MNTSEVILDAALSGFGLRGYETVSLDAVADEVGVSKQTVLYHFGSKEKLLEATIDHAAAELILAIEKKIANTSGWNTIEEIVGAVFRIAIQRPALLGLVREVMRLGAPWSTRAADGLEPIVEGARSYLEREMELGNMRTTDPRLLLVSAYSTVMGVATEIEVLRAVGIEPTLREAVIRRRELLKFLRSALVEGA